MHLEQLFSRECRAEVTVFFLDQSHYLISAGSGGCPVSDAVFSIHQSGSAEFAISLRQAIEMSSGELKGADRFSCGNFALDVGRQDLFVVS